jgi:uncharacterized membrane-anchored protein
MTHPQPQGTAATEPLDPLDRTVRAAVAAGILPPGTRLPGGDARPWPVVLLTALGAWLAALPLLGVVGLLLGDWMLRGAGPYVLGTALLAGAVAVLRTRGLALFVEQLAVPGLLVGGGALASGLFRDLPDRPALVLLALLAIGLAWLVDRPWLRVLLGALAAPLLALACLPGRWDAFDRANRAWFLLAWHACLALWLLALRMQATVLADGAHARQAAAVESLAAGWLLATLAGLAWWSGMTFLVGASLGGGFVGDVVRTLGGPYGEVLAWLQRGVSAVLAGGALLWLARRWPALRRPWYAAMAVLAAVLAAFLPALGGVAAALAVCVAQRRWRLAGAAALAAAWIVGSFYYQLAWSLATKSLVLVGVGALLGGLAAWAGRQGGQPAAAPAGAALLPLRARSGVLLTAVAVLAVANFGIWQKEDLIAHGQPVYVELAPVDPRSLMQGDYMQLAFRLPGDVMERLEGVLASGRPRLVARRDARGVATLQRLDDGTALAPDELRIELTPKDGRWILVTDAWFFKEGEAARWERARYGEFRVAPDGRALLVGLRGAELQPL